MSLRALVAGLAFTVLSSGCGTTYFMVQRRAPAEINIPAGVPMAVARVTGEGGDLITAELTRALVGTKRFQILERQHIDAAVAELKFSSEGYVSDDTAISFGEMTGAVTLVVGEVQLSDYREDVTQAEQECTRDEKKVPCTLFTRTARALLRLSLHVIETKTGHVLAAKTLSAGRDQAVTAYDNLPGALNAQEWMIGECRREVVDAFVPVIAPHDIAVRVALRSDGDLPELETGNNYALVGNWSAAVEQYRAAVTRAESNPEISVEQRAAARYNLGVGLGYSGAFDDGIAEVERAFALDPDNLYREQLGLLRQYKEDAARVAEQEPVKQP